MRIKKLPIAIATTVAAAGIGGAVAFAAWSASGSGSAGAAAKVAQNLVVTAVTPTSQTGASLYPGGPAGWVYVSIQNPNPYTVTITGLQWGTPTSNNTTSCANTNIAVDPNAPTVTNFVVPAGQTLSSVQINGVLDLSHSAPDGCQGVTFNVPLTVTGTQQ